MRKIEKNTDIISGVIRVHPRGFGFVQPEDKTVYGEDVFIPRHLTKGAVDGDIVEASVQPSPKGPEGKVLKILKRGRHHVAGTIALQLKKGAYAYVPLLGDEKLMRILPCEERELQAGDRIIIRVVDWGSEKKETIGEMSAYIGSIQDPSCDIQAAVEEFELEEDFSKNVLAEAKKFGTKVLKKDLKGREDLRELECLTIDPDTAKDFDDALSLSREGQGYLLGVHIADVSYYVKQNSFLDKEAKQRSNSVYFPGKVLPMLPHELSSHLCSLKPDVDRLAVTIFMHFDKQGTLTDCRVARTVIRSKKRFSYNEAKEILDSSKKHKFKKALELMVELCLLLKKKRFERGSIEFSIPDTKLHVNENGFAEKIEIVEYDITHQLVEEFMLKANEVVATILTKEGKPLAYRVHEEPNPENIKEFAALCRALGFQISESPTVEEIQALFDEARQSPFGQFLATSFIRSMRLAVYSTQNIGHYGLGLEAYTHFTSPIRRYVDLVVHRVLLGEIDPEEDIEETALQCSEKERLASRAENSVIFLKKLRLIQSLHKQQPDKPFEGVVSAIKPFGFFFELVDFLFSAFIPLSGMGKTRFYFDEKKKCLKSKSLNFKSGDKIKVYLKSINLVTQQTEWSISSDTKIKKTQKRKKR